MIDIEIHGTGGRTAESRSVLLQSTREALMNAPYSDQLTLVDTGSEVFNIQKIQAMPFARVYAPANLLDDTIADIRERLAHLFATLEGLQVIRVDTRKNAP
ncbi:MAG TPA: hypothetical protein VEN78_39875 [Bradyrhizobium sp.]|nr:hypothetical protein [Bradyrhizobium sp.]